VKLYRKLIEPEFRFILYNWMDDISAQFGLHNKAAIVVPSLEVRDLYRDKDKNGVTRSIKDRERKYHCETYADAIENHCSYWLSRYKFHRASHKGWGAQTTEFQKQLRAGHYKDTMQEKLFSWPISAGPKTLMDMIPLSKLRVIELKNIAGGLGYSGLSGKTKGRLIQLIEEKI